MDTDIKFVKLVKSRVLASVWTKQVCRFEGTDLVFLTWDFFFNIFPFGHNIYWSSYKDVLSEQLFLPLTTTNYITNSCFYPSPPLTTSPTAVSTPHHHQLHHQHTCPPLIWGEAQRYNVVQWEAVSCPATLEVDTVSSCWGDREEDRCVDWQCFQCQVCPTSAKGVSKVPKNS